MKMIDWMSKYCGYCISETDGSGVPDCACDDGRFDTRQMTKCKEEDCIPLKDFPKKKAEFRWDNKVGEKKVEYTVETQDKDSTVIRHPNGKLYLVTTERLIIKDDV